ncbi:thioredoxin [Comamonas serinivorans]|uniref:Thioredoxin n=1 Tax=Comamonas serinivorans TaxID=1082851 RepID=A0A1Y0EMQ9_9BURK|nr:thioredoxin [Comamonas serinivorans]ARU04923.1 thioredoxin [Comamonas serinivorans]
MVMTMIKTLTDANFEAEVLQSDKPVLVDYWAEWCGPCKAMEPAIEELASDLDGKVQVAKLNIDDNRAVPARFNVRGVPTFMLFKDGALVAAKVGAQTKSQLAAFAQQ